jgi:hypothetical protein
MKLRENPFCVPYLVYAERLDPLRIDALREASHLPRFQRAKRDVQNVTINRGSIISISRILSAVEVLPFFGMHADARLTKYNCLRFSSSFHLNIFSDRHIHSMFHRLY